MVHLIKKGGIREAHFLQKKDKKTQTNHIEGLLLKEWHGFFALIVETPFESTMSYDYL